MSKHNHLRRNFLGSMLGVAGGGALPFALNLAAMNNAAAQSASDYKAVVCLFLAGGNDQFNTVLATDPTSWNEYQRVRATSDAGSIALPGVGASGGVLPLNLTGGEAGRSFGLHPALGPLKNLFDAGRAAVVANVGPLIMPTTKAQYKARSVNLPPKLFSHNDQSSTWQASQPEGATSGWGGRMADLLASTNSNATFTTVSAAGNAVFLSGHRVRQYQISNGNALPIRNLSGSLFNAPASANPLNAIITGERGDLFEKEYNNVVKRSISAQAVLSNAMAPAGPTGVPDPTKYPNPKTKTDSANQVALQLQTVARIIAGRSALGARRQVFYVTMGSFDSHDGQKLNQADLLAKLAHAVAYFDEALAALPGGDMRKQVTLFTASEFGRTFTSNGDGTDHGWGSHHIVVGGAVKGNALYGSFPVTGLNHDLDVGSGALLPTTSVDQYGATIARWFGLSDSQLGDVFPNIGNFNHRNLGFLA
ncbi:MAG: DUF1501 domain-containing protein [Pseudomonadota bacterium]